MKAQSAVEFLATYAWAFLILTIFIAVIIVLVTIKNPSGYSPSSCYITPELACSESVFTSSASASSFAIVFMNNLGANLTFGSNSIILYPNYLNSSYKGVCMPSYAPKGSAVICNVTLSGVSYSPGSQINPNFKIMYGVCTNPNSCPSAIYNTSGSASDTIVYSKGLLSRVTLLTSTGTGHIALGGASYPSNTVVTLINNVEYTIYAQPPSGYIFNGWTASSNVTISGNTISASASARGSGSITASFVT
ncbi:MAG: hypothetical protein ACP5RF_00660 [Candidatus Micrarchaeia archaeon]